MQLNFHSLRSLLTEALFLSSKVTPDGGAPALPADSIALYWFIVSIAVTAWDPPVCYARWTIQNSLPIVNAWSRWRGWWGSARYR